MEEQKGQQSLQDSQTTVVGGEEATLVAPRFDDEETLVARPVVPLEEAAEEPHALPSMPAPSPAPYYRQRFAARRSWLPALMIASVFIGGVLGGAGLYLYQRQTGRGAASGAAPQAQVPAEAPQPAPTAEAQAAAAEPASQPEAPVAEVPVAEAPAKKVEAPPAATTREPESVPAAGRREPPAEGGGVAAPRRGKKGERDAAPSRPAQPDGVATRAGEREARRVDSIVYRPRRAARRERAAPGDADRLRRIFEGTPE